MDTSSTALLTAAGRARRADISLDRYASHWLEQREHSHVPALGENYAREAGSREDIGLSLRNRFFLHHLNTFAGVWSDAVFVNLAAGFTSYPYLVDRPLTAFEVDLPAVVYVKHRRSTELQLQGVLPNRKVSYQAADLSRRVEVDRMISSIEPYIDGRHVFLLMEGLTYYLSRDIIEQIIDGFSAIHAPSSVVAFDFWRSDAQEHPVPDRLAGPYAEHFGQRQGFTLFDDDMLYGFAGYRVAQLTHTVAQEAEIFGGAPAVEDEATFLEHYAILVRQG